MTHHAHSSPRRRRTGFAADRRGVAAVEFAMVLPIMLVMLFGVIEITSGVTAGRKLSMATRTLSDLVSRDDTIDNALLTTVFAVGGQMMAPHAPTQLAATISEIKLTKETDKDANGNDKKDKNGNLIYVIKSAIHWSKSATFDGAGTVTLANSAYTAGQSVTVPDALKVAGQYPIYLIRSNTSYRYVPMLGYVVPQAGITLTDETYTKPRQTDQRDCVLYGTATC
jgi:Flp pilus assembly protein TadG